MTFAKGHVRIVSRRKKIGHRPKKKKHDAHGVTIGATPGAWPTLAYLATAAADADLDQLAIRLDTNISDVTGKNAKRDKLRPMLKAKRAEVSAEKKAKSAAGKMQMKIATVPEQDNQSITQPAKAGPSRVSSRVIDNKRRSLEASQQKHQSENSEDNKTSITNKRRRVVKKQQQSGNSKNKSSKMSDASPIQDRRFETTPYEYRCVISCIFIMVYKCPPKDEWAGDDGTIAKLRKRLSWNEDMDKTILEVFQEMSTCKAQGVKYNAKVAIFSGSIDEQIMADLIEDGNSFYATTMVLNEYRKSVGNYELVDELDVKNACKRLNPVVTRIR